MEESDLQPKAIGAVLAGGASSRMGRPKATVPLGGRPMIAYPLDAIGAAGLAPVVVAKADSTLPDLECPVIAEPEEPRHPLAGIVAALRASKGGAVVAVACDMPFVEPSMLEALAAVEAPLVVGEVGGRLQPFPGRYGADLLADLEDALSAELPLTRAIAERSPRVMAEDELSAFGDPQLLCLSVNDAAGVEAAERELASRRAAER